jgi:prevent-host-death family protein
MLQCSYFVATCEREGAMPTTVGVRELKNHTSRVIRAVREEMSEYVVTLRGEPVALLRPLDEETRRRLRQSEIDETLAEMKALATAVTSAWTSEKSAVELITEQRR